MVVDGNIDELFEYSISASVLNIEAPFVRDSFAYQASYHVYNFLFLMFDSIFRSYRDQCTLRVFERTDKSWSTIVFAFSINQNHNFVEIHKSIFILSSIRLMEISNNRF